MTLLPYSLPFQEFSSNSSAVWSRNCSANLEHNELKSQADSALVWVTAQPRRKWIALYLTLQITGDPQQGALRVWKVGQIDLEGQWFPPGFLLCKFRRLNDRGY